MFKEKRVHVSVPLCFLAIASRPYEHLCASALPTLRAPVPPHLRVSVPPCSKFTEYL